MNRKRWLILAAALVVVGGMLFGGVMMAQNWDFLKLQTAKFETNTHQIQTPYHNISINIDTADLTVLPTEDTATTVVCYEQEKIKHTVEVKEDTLTIAVVDTRKWYEHIRFTFESAKITVYLPKATYETVSVTASTADIQVENLSANVCELSLSTGDMNLTDIQSKNIKATASTGDIRLKHVVAVQAFSAQTGTGDIFLEGCDAEQLKIKTSTGDVVGRLLSPKVFVAQTNTGDVTVPQSTEGGLCEIYTNTGDINITTP